ncbi:uncharacterized protein PADG_07382 [Paracoccidioides brasiliensis Pb18]|uniref:DUF8035 domain-containing protein n=1 Tax=Paracoccidioides brasiliensis (strain Pb18) TaxID=502780 RepID=C1GJE6_PARBD|nr:uncharacterized protein PADG_07382 [Paracoccidioides brasiliensis Pb18]EEH42562.2 hypothetical protein PADG_07382 [Paracoccidioides brasiliensis Pb18]
MPSRAAGTDLYERDTYHRDRCDRHSKYDHIFEEDIEKRKHRRRPLAPDPPDVRDIERIRERRHLPEVILRESHRRSSSAGPLARRPQVRDDDYEFEYEHEHEHERGRAGIYPSHLQRSRVVERQFSPALPPREVKRDELLVRRRERSKPSRRVVNFETDEHVVRRESDFWSDKQSDKRYDREWERKRGESEHDYLGGSYVRERPNARGDREEIIVRRDERERSPGCGKDEIKRDEVIIRRREQSSSSSSSSESSFNSPLEPPPIRAPPIHQDVITHHRHVDHVNGFSGYEIVHPLPPPSETSSRHADDEIEIRRTRERNGRRYDNQIIIDRESSRRKEGAKFVHSLSPPRRRASPSHYKDRDESERIVSHRSSSGRGLDRTRHHDLVVMHERESGIQDRREAANIREEAEYYNRLANKNSHIGEAYNGATKDWSIIDVPPGTKRVEMEGVGGASQEITWQRYNGVRRSKFLLDGDEYISDRGPVRNGGRIGKRYVGVKDKQDGLWTEITKDLVVKEAIERLGYSYEETQHFYYIFAYLKYDDVEHLVAVSEDYRKARRMRVREIERERAWIMTPPPLPLPVPAPPVETLLIERPEYEEERIIEHEIFVNEDKVLPPLRVRRW